MRGYRRNKIGGYGRKIKGSQRDPLFYFGISAVFFLFFLTLGMGLVLPDASTVEQESYFSQTNSLNFFIASEKSNISPPQSFLVMADSTMRAFLPPVLVGRSREMGVFLVAQEGDDPALNDINEPREGLVEYVVQSGDTSISVAQKFHISLETLLLANGLSRGSALHEGQRLIILPVDGVLHHVKSGDTISEIAKKYQSDEEKIIAFNGLANPGDIYVGDILIVPGGKMPNVSPKKISDPAQVPLASKYFICPLGRSCSVTQGIHWYNAVDFDANCGDSVFAAAEGRVLKVAITSSPLRWALHGAGNHLTILHPNGVVTYYGHIASSLVAPGQLVSQGERIALVGGKPGTPGAGLSTGCHLHFGVTGAKNPFAR